MRTPESAAIVLAGGRSARMGAPKPALDWHGSTLLRRVTGIVARAVDGPVVVVRAPGQALPELHPAVEVVQDAREGRGPLQGLAAGLQAIDGRARVAYATSTDVPLLHPAFVARVLGALPDGVDIVLPELDGHRQPLAAAYRPSLLGAVQELLAAERMGLRDLCERGRALTLDAAALLRDPALARCDPQLQSVWNLNRRADYERAYALPAPEIVVRRLAAVTHPGAGAKASARGGDGGDSRQTTVPAWSLGDLAAAIGAPLDARTVVAALNGDRIALDPQLPLVAGDELALLDVDVGVDSQESA